MADVLIKGMEMPRNCERCPIREGTFCDIIRKDIDRFYGGAVRRDKDCPLIAVEQVEQFQIDGGACWKEMGRGESVQSPKILPRTLDVEWIMEHKRLGFETSLGDLFVELFGGEIDGKL